MKRCHKIISRNQNYSEVETQGEEEMERDISL